MLQGPEKIAGSNKGARSTDLFALVIVLFTVLILGLERWVVAQIHIGPMFRQPMSVQTENSSVGPILDLGCVDRLNQTPRMLRAGDRFGKIKLTGRFCGELGLKSPEVIVIHAESNRSFAVFVQMRERSFITEPILLSMGGNTFEARWKDNLGIPHRSIAQIVSNITE